MCVSDRQYESFPELTTGTNRANVVWRRCRDAGIHQHTTGIKWVCPGLTLAPFAKRNRHRQCYPRPLCRTTRERMLAVHVAMLVALLRAPGMCCLDIAMYAISEYRDDKPKRQRTITDVAYQCWSTQYTKYFDVRTITRHSTLLRRLAAMSC